MAPVNQLLLQYSYLQVLDFLTTIAFMIDRFSQEDRVYYVQPSLLAYFAKHGILDGLAILDCPAEPGPAVGVGNLRFVIAIVEEKTAVLGHYQEHRRAPHKPPVAIR